MNKNRSIWSGDFILVLLAGLAISICMRMLDSLLASYASDTWASKTLGGQLTSFFNIGSITMAFFAGRLIAARGKRNMLMTAAALFVIPTVTLGLVTVPAIALLCRLAQGLLTGIITVSSSSIVSEVTPRDRMNEGMGMYNLGATLSFAFGPMLGLSIVDAGGYRSMFIACAVCAAAAALSASFIRYEKRMREAGARAEAADGWTEAEEAADAWTDVPKTADSGSREYRGIWKMIEKKALPAAFNHTVFFGSYAVILVFLTIYSQEVLRYSSSQIGFFYTVAAAVMLIVRFTTAKVGDKYGPLYLIVPGHSCMILALLVLVFLAGRSYIAFLAAGGLYGLGESITAPALNACAVLDSPKSRSSNANATFFFMMDFGVLFASAVFGALIDASASAERGYHAAMLISAGICALSLVMSVLFFNRRALQRRRG